jgi:hypothetical protein
MREDYPSGPPVTLPVVEAAGPADLTDVEAAELAAAGALDSGTLAERVADLAHLAAHGPAPAAGELRRLALAALELARRHAAACAAPPDAE